MCPRRQRVSRFGPGLPEASGTLRKLRPATDVVASRAKRGLRWPLAPGGSARGAGCRPSCNVIAYLRAHTEPLAPEYEATINLWLSRIEGTDQLPSDPKLHTSDDDQHEPNDYDHDTHSGE